MTSTESNVQKKNPTELLQDQVLLLGEVNRSLAELQQSQQKISESLAGLYALNREIFEDQPEVSVVNIHMPFWSMVVFIIKWTFASIPAILILAALGTLFWIFIGAILAPRITF